MIEMTILELGVTLVVLAILAIIISRGFTWTSDLMKRTKWQRMQRKCPVCYTTWLQEDVNTLAECPHCQRLTESGGLKNLG